MRNKVSLIGRLGETPEIQTVKGDYQVTTFSLATHERSKNKAGEWQDNTQWHRVVAWGKIAENLSKLGSKGAEIMIEGKLNNRTYEDKKGEKKYITEIETSAFLFIGSKAENDSQPSKQ